MDTAPSQNGTEDSIDMATFKKEVAQLREEFDLKTKEILDSIRDRQLSEVKKKIQS
jgi:hypothetical protein